ncbi:hypothetical protein, partial [Roseovarius sp. D22-M7]|uniref:hypothetical protein n=1 Tax=Roseovarius sp. D22-M7 TaxID=3127116 RepID=UPI00301008AA
SWMAPFVGRIHSTQHGTLRCRKREPSTPSMAFQWLTPDCQTAEIHIRIALMNRFSALGTAEIVRVA